jgi:hypothetical protein
MTLRPYTGYFKAGIGKDAAYSIKRDGGDWAVKLVYQLNGRERALLSTDEHDLLVEMVTAVQRAKPGGAEGGRFYINEFHHVLVPDGSGGAYYAGNYHEVLNFVFEGSIVSAEPPAWLQPGNTWPGPHVGMKHTLAAGGQDIKREVRDPRRPNVTVNEKLSDSLGEAAARDFCSRVSRFRGSAGGGIYINERGALFGPVNGEAIYLGRIGDTDDYDWFPCPPGYDE